MPRYALRFEFDGRGWFGTASQHNASPTLQASVEAALADYTGTPVRLVTCGRLDAGVSAWDFVAHCDLDQEREPVVLGRLINARLPTAVRVLSVAVVPSHWHARLNSCGKRYRYRIFERGVRSSLVDRALWIRRIPHPERLQPWADRLLGRQDLSAFACLRHDPSDAADPRHHIAEAQWSVQELHGGLLREFRVAGDGFLYKQVRGFVGALLAVARDEQGRARACFEAALAGGRASGQASGRSGDIAPAEGLVLDAVLYPPEQEPDWQSVV